MGSHHVAHKGPYMGADVYAIPFIAHWTGHIDGGRTQHDLFSTVNFTLTLGALCGIQLDAGAGFDQSAVLTQGHAGTRDAIFAKFDGQGSELGTGLMAVKSIRTHSWKLNLYLNDRSELYHLTTDPHELTNLIDDPDHSATRRDLAARIVHRLHESDDLLTEVFTEAFARAGMAET